MRADRGRLRLPGWAWSPLRTAARLQAAPALPRRRMRSVRGGPGHRKGPEGARAAVRGGRDESAPGWTARGSRGYDRGRLVAPPDPQLAPSRWASRPGSRAGSRRVVGLPTESLSNDGVLV